MYSPECAIPYLSRLDAGTAEAIRRRSGVKTMMRAKTGRIVFMSSVVGEMGNVGQTAYAASKAALNPIEKSGLPLSRPKDRARRTAARIGRASPASVTKAISADSTIAVTRLLVRLFEVRLDPERHREPGDRERSLDAALQEIRGALDAGIPVISINSGYETSQQLGLMTHVGQTEYDAGLGGGASLWRDRGRGASPPPL